MTGHTLNRAWPFYGTQPAAVNKCTNRKSNMAKDTLKDLRRAYMVKCDEICTFLDDDITDWNVEAKNELRRLLAEHREIGEQIIGQPEQDDEDN